ncbi:sodium/calcium exchanger protein [Hirsutella rhossiliensis]|uniref:Sodium/calcium exchanger protein n=1 Tax=Hirsutella rhossiliensis TaxID=111463 RepID=A0A9P8MYB1_9HYPO|nr:sodium/calcium exchanger protein [Hirsutella rhossiliensis]KAH0963202.1 sodium/calcium exchanger protein [Hirsutella rhossiliensis]
MQPSSLRRSRSRSRPFYATVLVLSLLTAYSFLAHSPRPGRDGGAASLFKRDEAECNQVHSVEDQCAFVRRHCMDADAGLLPYLEFYYCTLQHAPPVAFILLVAWLGLLFTTIGIAASDFFSVNLSTIAAILGLSQSLAGVTFLAFGNGSPDVFSTFAAMSSNSPSMAVGELIGAASFITGVVAGSMALVREFRVDRATYTRDICFFVVAVGFTMAFLADGQLRFWECWAMIGYYIVYVVTVVGCHWYGVRKRRRLRREGEARSHFYDDVDRAPGQPPPSNNVANGDALSSFEGLARSDPESQMPQVTIEGAHDDSDGDHERMIAAEVTRNMRILRTGAKRHHNMTPIRPSLVGALEFRSALAQLQRESNLQLSSIPGRTYSENYFGARARRGTVAVGLDAGHDENTNAMSTAETRLTRRDRALSSGDMPLSPAVIPELLNEGQTRNKSDLLAPGGPESVRRAPALTPSRTVGESLAPSPADDLTSSGTSHGSADDGLGKGSIPKLQLQIPSRRSSHSGASSPRSPFPGYTDSPMLMTPNAYSQHGQFMLPSTTSARREDSFPDIQVPVPVSSPVRWWPYSVLPPPHVLLATLFPTLQGWRDKSHWDRFLSTISVPSIFLLVITLPVVDSESSEDATSTDSTVTDDVSHGGTTPAIAVMTPGAEGEDEWERRRSYTSRSSGNHAPAADGLASLATREHGATAAASTNRPTIETMLIPAKAASDLPSGSNANNESPPWNRWLVCLQLFTGPLFATFILWANLREDWERPGRELVRMVLYSLVTSLVLLVVLLLTTTEHVRPRFYYLLCFLGFVISIAWISTIAGEVVGVLKAFGVILGISEALLGLTIFAAGNSVGDLVADITVARLGYPVMALSACFGGPMLNILLGIGIGGVMMMAQQAKREHAKHPDGPIQYGPYRVQVGGTLMISSITLLIMLFLLLILVPMNKWILSRRIGWVVIGLWALSTVVSVVIEVTGLWGEAA